MLYDVIIVLIVDLCEGNDILFVLEGLFCLVFYVVFIDFNLKYFCEFFRIRMILLLSSLKLIVDYLVDYFMGIGVLFVGDFWV